MAVILQQVLCSAFVLHGRTKAFKVPSIVLHGCLHAVLEVSHSENFTDLLFFFCLIFFLQIPSYGVVGANRRYANVRSKIDQSDPNPAHKLQHSVADLTIDSKQGREINPRFSNLKFASQRSGFRRGRTVDFNNDQFPRSSSLADCRFQRASSLDSPLGPVRSTVASTFPLRKERVSRLTKMSRVMEKEPEEPVPQDILEEAEEDQLLSGASVSSELDQGDSESTITVSTITFDESGFTDEDSDTTLSSSGICGMEVTASTSETTVVLKHILPLAEESSNKAGMTVIEEDEMEGEEEYYESQDTPISASSTESTFSLPNPIPRLIVTNELGGLVETVVATPKRYNPNHTPIVTEGMGLSPDVAEVLNRLLREDDGEESSLSTRL